MAPDGGSVNEQILDQITDRALDLQRLTAAQQKDTLRFLNTLEADIIAKLSKLDPEKATAKRLKVLLGQVKASIRSAYRTEAKRLARELRELSDVEAKFAAESVNKALGVTMMTEGLTRGQLSAIVGEVAIQGAPVTEWWERQAGDLHKRFTDQMRLGIAQGETISQLIRRVRGGTERGEPVVGIMSTSRRNAESLVRAVTQAVSQASRQATYEANRDVISAVMWVSTLDLRTTVHCAARDQKRYTLADKKPIDHDLPWGGGPGNLHWGCRSTSTPVTKTWRELGFDIDELPPAKRASMNGEAPADTTFETWLSKKSKAEQDDYLGPGRAQLWRDGKITFRDLVSGKGREMTLEELRKRTSKAA